MGLWDWIKDTERAGFDTLYPSQHVAPKATAPIDYNQDASPQGGSILDALGNKFGGFLDGLSQHLTEAQQAPQQQSMSAAINPLAALGPVPNTQIRSLSDLMQDRGLQHAADQQIISANSAIMRQNQDRHRQEVRDTNTAQSAGAHAQQQVAQVAHQHGQAVKAIQDAQVQHQDKSRSVVDDVLKNVAMNVIADDTVRSQMQGQQATAQQAAQSANDDSNKLLAQLGTDGADAMSDYVAAQPMQTKADVQAIHNQSQSDITTNSQKARDNWLQRSQILSDLATQQQSADQAQAANAINAYQAQSGAMGNWLQYQASLDGNDAQRAAAQSAAAAKAQPSMKDMLSLWTKFSTPYGPATQYVDKENNKQTFQPTYADVASPDVLKWFNDNVASQFGLPPVIRQQQPVVTH